MKKEIILLAGPTASGKSAIVLDWARRRGGEIVNADSMQIYQELDHLSARPSREQEAIAPHHLYGILRGDDPCSAERFSHMAMKVIEDIWARGAIPIVVGGTGLYFKSLTVGLSAVPEIRPEIRQEIRATITAKTVRDGHKRLEKLDPVMAARLSSHDTQRISRALEVILSTGKSLAYWQNIPPVGGLNVRSDVVVEAHVAHMERARLYERCDRRFRLMIEEGNALDEVRALMALDYPASMPIMKSLGVPQIIRTLRGEISLEDAVIQSQAATRQFAKRQMTWFRNQFADWNSLNV